MYIDTLRRPADFFTSIAPAVPISGGDTVSKKKIENIISLIASLDCIIRAKKTLFLAMALYPEVQKKAQAGIDTVVGPNRFPVLLCHILLL
jgi:hypothetical protein